ncbi:MAG TPA: hypothetical protein VFT52_01435, partial [Luteimonas sp.]|nr:hypothetical protein [Luteimonas sp.]
SDVSKLVAARNGVDLMPELGYRPTNKYLPPRPRRAGDGNGEAVPAASRPVSPLRWLDRILNR